MKTEMQTQKKMVRIFPLSTKVHKEESRMR